MIKTFLMYISDADYPVLSHPTRKVTNRGVPCAWQVRIVFIHEPHLKTCLIFQPGVLTFWGPFLQACAYTSPKQVSLRSKRRFTGCSPEKKTVPPPVIFSLVESQGLTGVLCSHPTYRLLQWGKLRPRKGKYLKAKKHSEIITRESLLQSDPLPPSCTPN